MLLSLIAAGKAKPDSLGIGLNVTADCAIVEKSGHPSDRLFAVGPLTRGAFLEIDAVPDIRLQCRKLATFLVGRKETVIKTEGVPGT